MTELLDRAFHEASRLPAADQDAFARWILEELASDRRWQEAFAQSPQALTQLASEARAEYRAGSTKPLDPDRL